jgi:hypothetical protein
MKLLMIGLLSLFSLGALANKNWEKLPFDQQKEAKLEKLEKKSALIEKSRTCVNKAKDKSDLKECSEEMKEAEQAMMNQWEGKKTKQSQESDGPTKYHDEM